MPKDQGHTKTFEELVRIEPETLIFVSKHTLLYLRTLSATVTGGTSLAPPFAKEGNSTLKQLQSTHISQR